jgi:hypothetical protein
MLAEVSMRVTPSALARARIRSMRSRGLQALNSSSQPARRMLHTDDTTPQTRLTRNLPSIVRDVVMFGMVYLFVVNTMKNDDLEHRIRKIELDKAREEMRKEMAQARALVYEKPTRK